jgi:hypothetical protein
LLWQFWLHKLPKIILVFFIILYLFYNTNANYLINI